MSDFLAKMHHVRFWLGVRPRPCYGSLMPFLDPLAGFKGPTSNGRREEKGRRRGWERNREIEGWGEREEKSASPFQSPGSATGEYEGAPVGGFHSFWPASPDWCSAVCRQNGHVVCCCHRARASDVQRCRCLASLSTSTHRRSML